MAVTSSNLNRFSKYSFTTGNCRKRRKFTIKLIYYFAPHLKYVAALPMGIWKFKFVVKLQNKIKNRTIFVSCIANDAVVQPMPSMHDAAKRCYHVLCFIAVWTPFINRQNNKDGKFKDCSWLFFCGNLTGLYTSLFRFMWFFLFAFSSRFSTNLNF